MSLCEGVVLDMWLRKCSLLVQVFFVFVCHCNAKPFFYNVPGALTTLAASASSPSLPYTNIADLRRRNEKVQKLQEEKHLVEDNEDGLKPEDADKNEASPNLFQKKINKIWAKLRFWSTLTDVFQGEKPSLDNNAMMDQTTIASNTDGLENMHFPVDKEDVTTAEPTTLQKLVFRKGSNSEPLRVNLKISELPDEDEVEQIVVEQNLEQDKNEMNKFGQVGVFFAEILGSIVGLAYGAASHLSNMAQGTTPQTV